MAGENENISSAKTHHHLPTCYYTPPRHHHALPPAYHTACLRAPPPYALQPAPYHPAIFYPTCTTWPPSHLTTPLWWKDYWTVGPVFRWQLCVRGGVLRWC